MRIKALVGSLISIGSPVTHQEHLDVILEGLPDEYQPIVTAIESRLDTYSLSEIESLLTTHERPPTFLFYLLPFPFNLLLSS